MPRGMWRALLPVQRLRASTRCMSTTGGSSSALEWLAQFVNYEKKGVPQHAGMDSTEGFDLGRMRRLLARLGNPHRQWAAVHVAGTKGKGSTTTLLASILTQSDYVVGTYTSPHVAAFHERISVDSVPISPTVLDDLVARHAPVIEAAQGEEGGALSHFEVTTALAYKHFGEQEVDMAVVEVGLGGVRDATNVLETDTLRCAVVTAIGIDHREALGDSIEEIAAAKAGIMKEGRPVVIARQPYPEAERVLRERAALLGCRVISAPQEVRFEQWGPEFVPGEGFRDGSEMHLDGPTVAALLEPFQPSTWDVTMRMVGAHQGDNAAAAVSAAAELKRQGFHRVTLQAVIDGLATAALPGRFQICRFAPPAPAPAAGSRPLLADVLSDAGASRAAEVCRVPGSPQDPWVVLDGAHTSESGAALAATLREVFAGAPLALVVAMAGDKQHTEFLAELRATAPCVVVFTTVDIAGGQARAAAPGALAAAWQAAATLAPRAPKGHRTRELIQANITAAVEKARMELAAQTGQVGVICVCGSMHAVGAALRQLDLVHC